MSFVLLGCEVRRWEDEDGGGDVEEVGDGGGEHQAVEVPLHDRAEREVDEAADVPNQAENANYYLAGKVKVIFWLRVICWDWKGKG